MKFASRMICGFCSKEQVSFLKTVSSITGKKHCPILGCRRPCSVIHVNVQFKRDINKKISFTYSTTLFVRWQQIKITFLYFIFPLLLLLCIFFSYFEYLFFSNVIIFSFLFLLFPSVFGLFSFVCVFSFLFLSPSCFFLSFVLTVKLVFHSLLKIIKIIEILPVPFFYYLV